MNNTAIIDYLINIMKKETQFPTTETKSIDFHNWNSKTQTFSNSIDLINNLLRWMTEIMKKIIEYYDIYKEYIVVNKYLNIFTSSLLLMPYLLY